MSVRHEALVQKLWRGIINFFVEALQEDKKSLAERKREAAARDRRWEQYLDGTR
jgi:hypothetical protein